VSLADKLDTIVGLFAAGEKPTGSRDPFGLRRAAQGVVKVLVDASHILSADHLLEDMIDSAFTNYEGAIQTADASWKSRLFEFFEEREAHVFERRGFTASEFRAVRHVWGRPANVLARLEALAKERGSADLLAMAEVTKRVRNITQEHNPTHALPQLREMLREPAEIELAKQIEIHHDKVGRAIEQQRFVDVIKEIVHLRAPLDRFFTDVLVMVDDHALRSARLSLLATVRQTIESFADISQMAQGEGK